MPSSNVTASESDGSENMLYFTAYGAAGWSGIRTTWGTELTIDDSVRNVTADGRTVTPANGVVPYDATLSNGKEVEAGQSPSVMDSANPGKLTVKGSGGSAGIGGATCENAGAIIINGGFVDTRYGAHGNALGQSCAHDPSTNKGHVIVISGGTVLTTSAANSDFMYDIGAQLGYTVITGGSVRVSSPKKLTGLGDTAYSTQGVTSWDDVDAMGGDVYDYGAPAQFDNGKLYLWLPEDAKNKVIAADLSYRSVNDNGETQTVTPTTMYRDPNSPADPSDPDRTKLKRYEEFEIDPAWRQPWTSTTTGCPSPPTLGTAARDRAPARPRPSPDRPHRHRLHLPGLRIEGWPGDHRRAVRRRPDALGRRRHAPYHGVARVLVRSWVYGKLLGAPRLRVVHHPAHRVRRARRHGRVGRGARGLAAAPGRGGAPRGPAAHGERRGGAGGHRGRRRGVAGHGRDLPGAAGPHAAVRGRRGRGRTGGDLVVPSNASEVPVAESNPVLPPGVEPAEDPDEPAPPVDEPNNDPNDEPGSAPSAGGAGSDNQPAAAPSDAPSKGGALKALQNMATTGDPLAAAALSLAAAALLASGAALAARRRWAR